MIYTKRFKFDFKGNDLQEWFILSEIKRQISEDSEILRYAIVEKNNDEFIVEASISEGIEFNRYFDYNKVHENYSNEFIVVNIVPTGVRAEIGGYIADATPVTNVMATIADKVITHPNVVNGSFLNYAKDNVLYVEGYMLDKFLHNTIALSEVRQNKIGVIIDKGALYNDELNNHRTDYTGSKDIIINTIESLRVIAGIDVIGYTITEEPIGGEAIKMPSGAFCGKINNEDTLLNAALKLKEKGATAIAIVSNIKIDTNDLEVYFRGELANPYGGTESLISHIVSAVFNIPTAHAPILSEQEKEYYDNIGIVDPRASSEVVSPAYLGCILKGLSKAPQPSLNGINLSSVKAIVIPYGCCGGAPAFMGKKYNIPLIAVKENKTVLNISPEKVGANAIVVENYLEAIGVIAALKSGITIESLRRPFKPVKGI